MEDTLNQVLMLVGTVATFMLVVKAMFKDIVPKLVKRMNVLPNDKDEEAAIWHAFAILIGIILAFTLYKDLSYFAAFDYVPFDVNNDVVKVINHLIVGIIAGGGETLGYKLFDWGKMLFGALAPAAMRKSNVPAA